MAKTKVLICPYCGATQTAGERCRGCGGLFEPLSRQATHNAMGPWFVRDPGKPFHPGCSYETLVKMVDRGQIDKTSIIRGPTTRQFWTVARRVPGVAHLLGYCHSCDAPVDSDDHGCHACGVPFGAYLDRNFLGLPEIRPLPWEAPTEEGSLEAPPGTGIEASAREPAAGRLSQFASDAELLDGGAAAGAPGPSGASAPVREWARPRPVPAVATDAPAMGGARPTVFDDSTSAAVTRALRRRLASQQRMIRVMAVLVVVGLVIALASNLDKLARLTGGGRPSPGTQEAPVGSSASADDKAAAAAIEELDASITGRPSSEDGPEAAAPAQVPGTAPPAGPTAAAGNEAEESSPEAAILAVYTRARALISAAARGDRALEERIRDYEQALESLEALGGSALPGHQTAELPDLIERVERELERLKLKQEFFG
ncbi:MAG: hypothetical protein ACYS1E_17065 [Planctomycetota bacterium]|jgi:hypothetical protein